MQKERDDDSGAALAVCEGDPGKCPICGAPGEGGAIEIEGRVASQQLWCTECDARWVAEFALVAVHVECPDCGGTGEREGQIGGDGFGGRCCALADVPLVCSACDGTGAWKA